MIDFRTILYEFNQELRGKKTKVTSYDIIAYLRERECISLPDENLVLYGNQFLNNTFGLRSERYFGMLYGYSKEKVVVLHASNDACSAIFNSPPKRENVSGIILPGLNFFPKSLEDVRIWGFSDKDKNESKVKGYAVYVCNMLANDGRYGITHERWKEMKCFLNKFLPFSDGR